MDFSAHETAIIEPSATIGRGTRVWHHSHVRSGATIGENCTIGKDVYIDTGVRIGSKVKIQNGVLIYDGVTIEDEVLVGPGAVLTNDRYPRAVSPDWQIVATLIRQGATIGANATVVCPVEDHELLVGNPARRIGWVCACGRTAARTHERPADLRCDDCRRAGHPAR
jgi:UDP-2-acetamido-3-amino-2,3-dideoxy-glucuronate N-acetyltransferase